jgi:Icc-related predicted phosphoesterase
MKIALVSDVHLEFGDLDFDNDSGADVLILGGDICVASDMAQRDPYNTMGEQYRSNRFHDFFQRCSDRFPHVIFIVGNHEHYHGDFARTVPHFKDVLGYLPNLHILEKETFVLDDITFIGGTLWTDMNRRDNRTLHDISRMMNDFRCVDNTNKIEDGRGWPGRFTTTDAANDHDAMVAFIDQTVAANPAGRYVVVGHHSPSRLSTHPKYQDQFIMNGGYSSSLDDFIQDRPQIKLWTHGHTHEDFDYMIAGCRILCNPRGYINYEERADTWRLKTVEV